MKNYLIFTILATAVLTSSGCEKDPPEAILSDEVEFGESVVYLNGEVEDYVPDFQYDSTIHVMSYGFEQSLNQGQLTNLFGFGLLPLAIGDFKITSENKLFEQARASFHQTVSEDLDGYEYKLVDASEGFLNIEYLDSINMEVKGRFKAKFCRTSKNGNKDLGLPKNIVFQGVFYENYVFK